MMSCVNFGTTVTINFDSSRQNDLTTLCRMQASTRSCCAPSRAPPSATRGGTWSCSWTSGRPWRGSTGSDESQLNERGEENRLRYKSLRLLLGLAPRLSFAKVDFRTVVDGTPAEVPGHACQCSCCCCCQKTSRQCIDFFFRLTFVPEFLPIW